MSHVVDISNRYFAIVGDDGFCYTNAIGVVMEAFNKMHNVSIMEFSNGTTAYQYAVCAYCSRFFMRNFKQSIPPCVPLNLPINALFIDENFQAREGDSVQPYFPGISI